MKCEEVQNNISAFLDNELPEDFKDAISKHFDQCPACTGEKDRIVNTVRALNTVEIPELKSDVFLSISSAIERTKQKSYALLTGILWMFSFLAAVGVTVFAFSPTGEAVVGVTKALLGNVFELGSLAFRISTHFTVGPTNWLSLVLFLGFLLSLWALRKISNSSSLGGPVHE